MKLRVIKRISVFFVCVLGLIGTFSGPPSNSSVANTNTDQAINNKVFNAPIETDALVPVESAIEFSTRTINDANVTKGETTVVQTGVNGVRTSTYKVYYLGGVEQRRELISEVISKDPIEEIVSVGSKVEPSTNTSSANYYTNVDGAKVQSPTYSETVPSGASAQCRDGTYSFSHHRQGTCSGHGGVAQWL